MKLAQNIAMVIVFLLIAGLIIWRLPINGWGSLVWLAGFFIMCAIRIPIENASKQVGVSESRRDTLEIVLLAAVGIGTQLLPILELCFGIFGFAGYSLPPYAIVAGALLMSGGLWLFWRSHADLGRNWSVTLEIREQHELVTTGIYQHIRHPMYSAIWLMAIAQIFLIGNGIAGLAGVITFGAMYFVRVPQEESMMRDLFGDDYTDYCQRSGRLWPRLAG